MSLLVRTGEMNFYGDQPRRVGFNVTDWSGWVEGVSAQQDVVLNPAGDGAYDLPSKLNPRNVSLNGYVYTDGLASLGHYSRLLSGMLAVRQARPVYVDVLEKQEWSFGKVIEKPDFKEWGGQPFADFSVEFWFPKPQIFGTIPRIIGPATSLSVPNRGNSPASLSLLIEGSSAGGYTVSGPLGRKYIVTAPLLAGHPHTIDMKFGNLTIDGVIVASGVTRANRWAVPNGWYVDMSVAPNGAGSVLMTSTSRDTNV